MLVVDVCCLALWSGCPVLERYMIGVSECFRKSVHHVGHLCMSAQSVECAFTSPVIY